jgi:hypothetical protein
MNVSEMVTRNCGCEAPNELFCPHEGKYWHCLVYDNLTRYEDCEHGQCGWGAFARYDQGTDE